MVELQGPQKEGELVTRKKGSNDHGDERPTTSNRNERHGKSHPLAVESATGGLANQSADDSGLAAPGRVPGT